MSYLKDCPHCGALLEIREPTEGGPRDGSLVNCAECGQGFEATPSSEPGVGGMGFADALGMRGMVQRLGNAVVGLLVGAFLVLLIVGVYIVGWQTGDTVGRVVGLMVRAFGRSV